MPYLSIMTAFSPGGCASMKMYDYCLKFLLVGDSDVGKNEILNLLENEYFEANALYPTTSPKTTVILLEGKKVKLQLWDTSGQGRFSTIIRSYSRGAQGILVVYDITNHWSFEGISRWLKEIDEQAPGVPKILIGNRLHLEFRRQVSRDEAEHFAHKKNMEYFEVSTLALFNICESLTELSRLVLTRNGMERLWKNNKVQSLQEVCCRSIAPLLRTVHDTDRLPLPPRLQCELKSFADGAQLTAAGAHNTLRRRVVAANHSHVQVVGGGCCGAHRTISDMTNGKHQYSSTGGTFRISLASSPLLHKLTNRRRRATVTLPGLMQLAPSNDISSARPASSQSHPVHHSMVQHDDDRPGPSTGHSDPVAVPSTGCKVSNDEPRFNNANGIPGLPSSRAEILTRKSCNIM